MALTAEKYEAMNEEEERAKVQKYKEALEKRKAKAAAAGEGDLMAQGKWGNFYKRVHDVQESPVNPNMESFLDVLKKVVSEAEIVEEAENSMILAAEDAGLPSAVENDAVKNDPVKETKEKGDERTEAAAAPPAEATV
jgi:hypothetical protein